MAQFSFIIQYVRSPADSAAFYSTLLGVPVVESSPTFAMLPLREGVMLGLWSESGVQPEPTGAAGRNELALTADSASALEALHTRWLAHGARIAQAPVRMDFGYTFVALDPDGHRLRVLVPGG